MTHLAMWEGTDPIGEPETEWGEHVTDDEYHVADGSSCDDQRSGASATTTSCSPATCRR